MLGVKRWDNTFLDAMRQVGDPLADAVVTEVVNSHGVGRVNEMMRSLVRNDDLVPADMPAVVRDYLLETERLPDWADRDLIAQGERFFDYNWPIVVTLLFCASLPSAYAADKGAQVLYLTHRLTQQVHRRIFETAQFILDVMAPGGLSGEGRGIRSAQKVRLLHTAIRHFVEHVPEWRDQWDPAWGVPINQEDLAGTMMTFSLQVLVGMKRFRMPTTAADEEAYLHAWKVVGHIIGIHDELMPANVDEAYELATTIFNRQRKPSQAGLDLTSALLAFMDGQIHSRLFRGFPATIMRNSIDADVADMLQVPAADWTTLLFRLEEVVLRALARFELSQRQHSRLLQRFSYDLVQELVKIERGGDRSLFRIPPTLRAPI